MGACHTSPTFYQFTPDIPIEYKQGCREDVLQELVKQCVIHRKLGMQLFQHTYTLRHNEKLCLQAMGYQTVGKYVYWGDYAPGERITKWDHRF